MRPEFQIRGGKILKCGASFALKIAFRGNSLAEVERRKRLFQENSHCISSVRMCISKRTMYVTYNRYFVFEMRFFTWKRVKFLCTCEICTLQVMKFCSLALVRACNFRKSTAAIFYFLENSVMFEMYISSRENYIVMKIRLVEIKTCKCSLRKFRKVELSIRNYKF